MNARLIIVVLAAATAGCSGVSKMNSVQIANISDDDLCDAFAKGPVVEQERVRRNLGDCTPVTLECKKLGYAPGSQAFLDCRRSVTQEYAAAAGAYEGQRQQILQNFQNGWQKAYASRPPSTSYTTCSPGGTGANVSCQTTSY